jgi:hypothetical protein
MQKKISPALRQRTMGTILAQDWCRPNMLGLLDQAFTDKLQFVETKKKRRTTQTGKKLLPSNF